MKKDIAERPGRIMVGSRKPTRRKSPETGVSSPKHPQLIGDFTWTGWDYIGEAGVGVPAYAFGEGGFGAAILPAGGCGRHRHHRLPPPGVYSGEIVFGLRRNLTFAVQNPYRYRANPATHAPGSLSDTVSSWTYPDCVKGKARVH